MSLIDQQRNKQTERGMLNTLRFGVISHVDHAQKRLKVDVGLETGWLPWPAEIGRNYKRWRPLREGTQVLVGAIGGDFDQAAIVGVLYTAALDAPSTDPDLDIVQFDDGAELSYHSGTGTMTLRARGDLNISVGGNLVYDVAGVTDATATMHFVQGPVEQTGGDMTSDGVSAQSHKHEKVKAGLDTTGGPL